MGRVLLVDDQAEVRAGVRKVLERLGHLVGEATDGAAALRRLGEEPWEVVVTDVNMPGMDGIELIMAIRDRHPGLPVIAFSGGGMISKDLLLTYAGALGAVSTLSKPVEVEELRAAVDRALEGQSKGAAENDAGLNAPAEPE